MAHMEDVLDLYAEPYEPQKPVVCGDETSTQMLSGARPPIPVEPGQPRREDYEYRREGTRNLSMACEPLSGWRHVSVTQRRTTEDFGHQMRWLVDEAYPDVPVVRVVLDNLNTHARPRCTRLSCGRGVAQNQDAGVSLHPPKHGSRLNPVLSWSKGWRRFSSASSPAVASGSVSLTRQPSARKSTPWNWSETKLRSASTGASASRTPERNSIAYIPPIPSSTPH